MNSGGLAHPFLTVLLSAFSLAFFAGCPDQPEPEEPEPEPEPEVAEFELVGDAEAGQPVYDAQCASCHGPEGLGDGPAGAALDPEPSDLTETDLSAEEIYLITRDGGPALGQSALMPPFDAALDEEGLHDVTAYVLEFSQQNNPSPIFDEESSHRDDSDAQNDDSSTKEAGEGDRETRDGT